MSDNVVQFPGTTVADVPPEYVLENASKEEFECVIVLGFCKDGDFYFSSSVADGGTALWLMELAKKQMLENDE